MALSNRERVGQMLELLRAGLQPFVERELKSEYKGGWLKQAAYSLRDFDANDPHFDAHALLVLMTDNWQSVFKDTLGHAERSYVGELRTVRNDWAHQKPFSTDDTERALDTASRLLNSVSAPEAQDLKRMRDELLRLRGDEQMRSERRKAAAAPLEGQPAGGLRPWREIVTPHPDVASGRYQQAEFAADLWQVYLGEGSDEYRNPGEFFNRTFITEGLRKLLVDALQRVSGQPVNGIIQLKTNFGGGKTHSMLALYHLFSGTPAGGLPGIEPVVKEAGVQPPAEVRRVVLVGNKIPPGQPMRKPDGTVVRTLWGEIAWQLGGAEGFAMLREADETSTNPGDRLRELFNRYAPCLILIDEWVAYARQLHDDIVLPGGTFDTHFTFAQSLTEAVNESPGTLLVVSLPASDIETGGERGRTALSRLNNVTSRVDSPWRPASAEESFEIVRRRLFTPIRDETLFRQRDAVIAHFARLYREQPQEFPDAAREGAYERRMLDSYPIHPELFDRLYTDWSSLEKFQRTRGVLRLMAAVIHSLWERNDAGLVILPASIPIDDQGVLNELTRYLEDNWSPVIERDVDGAHSVPLAQDRENPNYGRYSACRRVARTIFMGSAPTLRTQTPGIEVRRIKLGCVQPGESVATFGDALRRLTDHTMHLYVDHSRYWYSTQASVSRLAQDRAAMLDEEVVWEELKVRLRADRQRDQFAAVHAQPESSGEVPDTDELRLVILSPKFAHTRKGNETPAQRAAHEYLKNRGNAPRINQNMLVFLAAEQNQGEPLAQALRSFLAWRSIRDEEEQLNLDAFQRNQARTKFEDANRTVDARILETFLWLLVPYQSDAADPMSLVLEERKLQGQEPLAVQAGKRLETDGTLYTKLAGSVLRMEMDKFNLWGQEESLRLRQLWEYFARYPYLPRLRDRQVLLAAVQDGVGRMDWSNIFAYADERDGNGTRFIGLRTGESGAPVSERGWLVQPAAAQRQIDGGGGGGGTGGGSTGDKGGGTGGTGGDSGGGTGGVTVRTEPRYFTGSVELDALRVASEAAKIAEAIIQHLTALPNARVSVHLEISADVPSGIPEAAKRTVAENAATLHFRAHEFE